MTLLTIYLDPPLDFLPTEFASACYFQWKNKFLILQRNADKTLGNSWGVPAGKLDVGETPRQAVVREAFEEVGIKLEESNLKELRKLYVRRDNADVELYRYLIQCSSQPNISLNLKEHSSAKWLTLTEALALPNITGAVMGLEFLF
jgi:mutator protein MutT